MDRDEVGKEVRALGRCCLLALGLSTATENVDFGVKPFMGLSEDLVPP